MAKVACFTSFSYSYLPRARILAQTVRRVHPEWSLWAVVVDKPPPTLDLKEAFALFDHVIDADALNIPRFRAWIFKHDLVEACTAVKGHMLLHMLENGAKKVIYLDPDIAVFGSMEGILARLDGAAIVLTPHQVAPNSESLAITDNELVSMKFGVFNLGFLAVGNNARGLAFAEWWAGMLHHACYAVPREGLFTDQKYCDLVPGLFDGVHIERDPGCNVASWNLSRRQLSFSLDGNLCAEGVPLKFYHFSKIGSDGDGMTERYAGDSIEVHELVAWYKRQLVLATPAGVEGHVWHYASFTGGARIPISARLLLRKRQDLYDHFDDPFTMEGSCYYEWLRRHQPDILGSGQP